LIENEIIRLHEDEIKKIENVMLKKMTAKTKNLSLQKKSEFMRKKTTIRKRKRKENKIIKKLKKNSKSKRFYRRRLQNSSISVFSTSQMRKTTSEIEKLILQIEKNKVDNSASSIKDYVYQ
jgi:Mg2+ and Co2+ transporter CorA